MKDEGAEKDESAEYADKLIEWIKQELGVELGTEFAKDDWTLVVKLHALIEASLNEALVRQLQTPELHRVIGKLDTSNTATGKIAFAKALNILEKDAGVFIQKLSELRNFCVHDVRNFNFDLDQHIANLKKDDRTALLSVLNKQIDRENAESASPRIKIIAGTLGVMAALHVHHLACQARNLRQELLGMKAAKFDEQHPSTPKDS